METVTDLKTETVDGLKKLIRMNHDASKGYSDAADDIDDDGCKRVFRAAGEEREQMATELMAALQISDEDVPEGGSALGLFHRCWLNIRSAVTGGDEETVLAEAIRGESALADEYEEVLVDTVGSPLNAKMQQHLALVRQTRDGLEALKASHE